MEDMDILVDMSDDNAEKILKVLKDFWGSTIGFAKDDFTKAENVIMMERPPFRIDILTSISGIEFKKVYESSKLYNDDGIEIRCIHINELIRNKRASGRLQDLADAEMLEKILRKRKK